MKLIEVLAKITPETILGNTDIDIEGVNIDSRMIKKGHLFIAEEQQLAVVFLLFFLAPEQHGIEKIG